MMKKWLIVIVGLLVWSSVAGPAQAQTPGLSVSGWIPYWKLRDGIREAKNNLEQLREINPFGYSVKSDGTLNDLAKLKSSQWSSLFRAARKQSVRVIPTVMWSDKAAMTAILGDPNERADHIAAIAAMVRKGKYDGVDIDYEAKPVALKDGFSAFLVGLKQELGEKILSCTIEVRQPSSALGVKDSERQYSNDYAVINRVCDEIKIMAYDQRRADLELNAKHQGELYSPVADVAWAEKVLKVALASFPAGKVWLGVPTYGYEYEVKTYPSGYREYTKVRAVNPDEAWETARQQKVTPARNQAGELSFSYQPKGGNNQTSRLVWWSDAEAIRQKIALAQKFNLAGVAIFKLDGGADQNLWPTL